ncbi:MAG: DUF4097 family beta strand repeat-containing protein [Lachnospiraceae bacterium]|nr:DUF4097 family beta strand repeat-containing protein [Lachnospiraceae bacterium]
MKFVKYTAVLGAVLTVLGFGTAQAAKVNGGVWDGNTIQSQSMVIPNILSRHHFRREYRISEDAYTGEWVDDNTLRFPVVSELSLELLRGNVTVITGEGKEILVICDSLKTRKNEMLFYQEDDEMKLQIGKSEGSAPSVTVVLPEDHRFQEVDLEIAAGSCNLLELMANELKLQVAAGDLVIQNGKIAEADFECAAGAISYTGQIMDEADVDCAAGSIHLALYQKEEDFNYEVEGTGGQIQIGDTSLSGVIFQKELDHRAARTMELQCAGGQIQVSFLENGI